MPPRQIIWVKNNQNNDWFDFLRLNLDAPYFSGKTGIYVIWYASPAIAKVIRVGSGSLSERLKEHRSNPEITKFSNMGQLKVTWAVINQSDILGIEKYLSRVYSPLVGDRFPDVPEIPVNLIGQ